MSTRAKVETAIAALEDKGSNTAKEVREALSLLLDYTENEAHPPTQQNIVPFSFVTDNSISDGRTGSQLQYSCRGFVGEFANFTFHLKISDDSKGNIFLFPLKKDHAKEFMKVINEILPTKAMRFSIPFKLNIQMDNLPNGLSYAIPTKISFLISEDDTPMVLFDMDFTVMNGNDSNNNSADFPLTNASTYTSVCFHSSQKIIEDH